MNKTLIALGVGIWGIVIILNFIFRSSLENLGLGCQTILETLLPLTVIEIVAFAITIIGIIKRD